MENGFDCVAQAAIEHDAKLVLQALNLAALKRNMVLEHGRAHLEPSSCKEPDMANTIIRKRRLIPGQTSELVIKAPHIAGKARPGNFVILRVCEKGERIPLTIADADPTAGSITLVYLVLGKTTSHLDALEVGDVIQDLCGPLGRPTDIHPVAGAVICVGGGTGIAAMHHIAKGHQRAGNRVIGIIGARTRDLLLFEEELSRVCSEMLITTNDGSHGRQGMVTLALEERLAADPGVAEVVAVGPVPMMAAVAEVAVHFNVRCMVSLNSIMVDGVGMCGACRVKVGGETCFACVDGPEFDGALVDFTELSQRLTAFRSLEHQSYEEYKKNHVCRCSS
jgi:ferredoxin--NADP+ reductase